MVSLKPTQLATISRLFSSYVLRELCKKGQSALFRKLVDEAKALKKLKQEVNNVGEVFDVVFNALSSPGIRNEYIYKSAIAHRRLLGVHSLNTAAMLEEFRVGNSKADVVIINGTSTVYEIKSERDTLARLSSQLDDYQRVFARINVITSKDQVNNVLAAVPDKVGVLCLTKRYQISTVREPISTPESICPVTVMGSLRQNEVITILQKLGVEIPQVPNTQHYQVMRSLFESLDPTQVHDEMVKALRVTRNQARLNSFIKALPSSLQAAALSVPMKISEQERLLEAVNTPLDMAMNWR